MIWTKIGAGTHLTHCSRASRLSGKYPISFSRTFYKNSTSRAINYPLFLLIIRRHMSSYTLAPGDNSSRLFISSTPTPIFHRHFSICRSNDAFHDLRSPFCTLITHRLGIMNHITFKDPFLSVVLLLLPSSLRASGEVRAGNSKEKHSH